MMKSTNFSPKDFLVLVVDDYVDTLKELCVILEGVGYRVSLAHNGTQALERLAFIRPDLIVLDFMMPDMSGLDVCKAVQKNPDYASIPIIFLSVSQDIDHLAEAFEFGAVDYVTKPFRRTELLARIRTHLELKHFRDLALRQVEHEQIINSITQGISQSLNLSDVLQTAGTELLPYLNANRVLIGQFNNQSECICLAEAKETEFQDVRYRKMLPIRKKHLEFVRFQQWRMSDAMPTNWSESHRYWLEEEGIQSELVIPIFYDYAIWGVFIAQCQQQQCIWSDENIRTLLRIIKQLEMAIQHSILHEQLCQANERLKYAAHTDSLTQLANRRHFDEFFSQEWARLQRDNLPLSLLLCDVDYFKQYNDYYGHAQGDWGLQQIATALAAVINRPADLVARYGGEEFVILLPNTGRDGAEHIAQQVQTAIAHLKIPHHASKLGSTLTLSIGIAVGLASHQQQASDLLQAADKALYAAKSKGRNCYIVDESSFLASR